MMLMMNNKKLAQGLASKILKKSPENPEMLEKENVMDESKLEVAKDLMGALENKDVKKFLSAFRALMLACESDEEIEEDTELEMPKDSYGDKLTKSIEIEVKK